VENPTNGVMGWLATVDGKSPIDKSATTKSVQDDAQIVWHAELPVIRSSLGLPDVDVVPTLGATKSTHDLVAGRTQI
jgi:hypothetical protein